MILDSLYQAIEAQPGITQVMLAKRFSLSEDGVDAMLAVWIKKNKLSRMQDTDKKGEIRRVRYYVNHPDALALTVSM